MTDAAVPVAPALALSRRCTLAGRKLRDVSLGSVLMEIQLSMATREVSAVASKQIFILLLAKSHLK